MLLATDIRAGYGAEDILRGIGFKLRAGEVLGVVGPNRPRRGRLQSARTIIPAMLPISGNVASWCPFLVP